jgi:hypothetical protein
MCVLYFFDDDGEAVFDFVPYHRFIFEGPSECCLMVPMSYAEAADA